MDNNFNNQQNNIFKGLQMPKPLKTNSAIKYSVAFLLGVIPLLLTAMFIGSTGNQEFNQWGQAGEPGTINTYIDYGLMWLIGLAIYIASVTLISIIGSYEKIKFIHLDIIPATSGFGLAMLNLFVIPHSAQIFMILSIPSFFLIGYIIGVFVMLFTSISKMQRDIRKSGITQEDIMKQMMNGQQNPFMQNNKHPDAKVTKPKNKTNYEDNPFVDVSENEDNDDEQDSKEEK